MDFPSPAPDYVEQTHTITSLFGYDGNCRTIETSSGHAIINVAIKPEMGDTVLISFCGSLDFAKLHEKALITQDGEAIEGNALDDVTVMGVVTHHLNRVKDTDDRSVI
ncbi:hypothetical protein FZI32_22060 [Cronobacter sakazakii]|nr:hypothetical protein [Cronobacter sakazakii]ELY2510016.1 hypothetical protein [Cronobacter sakazakii]ELY3637031.1 hypothetical protein [Cronobacter sakazakii]ELY3782816.1 hypothetical protein [Cronobacter sakazakii]ELY4624487.1 hypothetical protein [Cronobacter sakazakii]